MTTPEPKNSPLLKPARPVGFIGYGAYVPRYRIPAKEIARVWAGGKAALPIKEKSVPGMDEDVITMSIEAARNALARAEIHAHQLRAVWVGSEFASVCRETDLHSCGRSHRRRPQRPGR